MNSAYAKPLIPSRLYLPLFVLLLMWGIHIVNTALGMSFTVFGLYPRSVIGLRGVLLSPLLHGSWSHLISNTVPYVALSAILFFFYRRIAVPAFLMIYLLTGVAVWLFGRPVIHVGTSGVVYGLVAFVFWTGIFRRSLKSIVLSLVVIFYYGSMFLGILPGQDGISWESHLLGALVGIFVAYWFKGQIEQDEERPVYSWEEEEATPSRPFLPRDTFDKTRRQREAESQNRPGGIWRSDDTGAQ